MSRLTNRDVDDLTHMEYEDALSDGEPWADESLAVREVEAAKERWAALNGKRVAVEFDDGCSAEGVWQYRGQTAEDFYLVYINAPEDPTWVVVGCDARSFDKVTVLDV